MTDGSCVERHGLTDAEGNPFPSKKRLNHSIRIHFVVVSPSEISKPEFLNDMLRSSGQNQNDDSAFGKNFIH